MLSILSLTLFIAGGVLASFVVSAREEAYGVRSLLHMGLHNQAKSDSLQVRQTMNSPPTTTIPQCDEYDNYFYVTPRNYTWQLQCSTNYDGAVLSVGQTANFSACIGSCIEYNRATTPGSCLAVTFNGANDAVEGQCTQYSHVTTVSLAYEEGNVQDSALLISGPDGAQYAEPQPDPEFSGAATVQPTAISGTASTTSTHSPTTWTVHTTTTVTLMSCPANISGCTSWLSTDTLGSSSTAYSMVTPSSTPSIISITDGGPRPPMPVETSSATLSGQQTFTSIIPFTEYRVQVVEICTATPTTCSQSTMTSSKVGYRTQISCSPGTCMGVVIAAADVPGFEASGVCVAGM